MGKSETSFPYKMIKFSVEVDTVLGLGLSGARSASGKLTLIYYKKKKLVLYVP